MQISDNCREQGIITTNLSLRRSGITSGKRISRHLSATRACHCPAWQFVPNAVFFHIYLGMFGLVDGASHNRTEPRNGRSRNPTKRCASIRLEGTFDGQEHALNRCNIYLEMRE